jgi:hypothetical protein
MKRSRRGAFCLGSDNFNCGFLPATFQGSVFKHGKLPVANLTRTEPMAEIQQAKIRLLQKLDRRAAEQTAGDDQIESAIANYELAFRMQQTVPELMDLGHESQATRRLYVMNADYAVENKVEIHDLHATMLHLLGVDHERLTFRFSGRDMRLTDVHGKVVRDILA